MAIAPSSCGWRARPWRSRARPACSTPPRTARCTRRYGVALAAHDRHEEALPALEKGVFLRRLWAQKLDLVDGLIALATTVEHLGDRDRAAHLFAEAEELVRGCRDPGVLPRTARRRRGGHGRPSSQSAS